MTTWLCLVLSDKARKYGGNLGYNDLPDRGYPYDSTVPNHGNVRKDDVLLLSNSTFLIGAGRVMTVRERMATKTRQRCPQCSGTGIKLREVRTPRYRCGVCKTEFEHPEEEQVDVTQYEAIFAEPWQIAGARASHDLLRRLCQSPKSYHSIRAMQVDALPRLIDHGTIFATR